MDRRQKVRPATAAICFAMGLTGCSSIPEWVNEGGAAFPEDKGRTIYGVGRFWGTKNPALGFCAADARARMEVSKTLNTFVASVMKDYMKSAIAGDIGEAIVKKAAMVHCKVVERHYHERGNIWYALARVELDSVALELRRATENINETRKLWMEAAEAREELDRIIRDTAAEMY